MWNPGGQNQWPGFGQDGQDGQNQWPGFGQDGQNGQNGQDGQIPWGNFGDFGNMAAAASDEPETADDDEII